MKIFRLFRLFYRNGVILTDNEMEPDPLMIKDTTISATHETPDTLNTTASPRHLFSHTLLSSFLCVLPHHHRTEAKTTHN